MDENGLDIILVDRLYEFIKSRCWFRAGEITIDDIEDAIIRGVKPIKDQYKKYGCMDFELTEEYNENEVRDWHIGRIIYFIQNPEEIIPIEMDNKCSYNYKYFYPIPLIYDGNHRFLAKVYLKHKTIKAYYSGRIDLLDYLTGKTDVRPIECLKNKGEYNHE